MKVIRFSDARRRQKDAAALDAAIEAALDRRALGADFERELRAAEAVAGSVDPVSVPPEALVALRAAVAARKAAATRHKRRVLVRQALPSAAAVAAGGLVFAAFGLHPATPTGAPQTNDARAAQALQDINLKMAEVQNGVTAHDPTATATAAVSARSALVQAVQLAESQPASNPVTSILLQAAELKIALLQQLLAQAHLPPVAPLPEVHQASPAASTTTTTTGGGSTTTSAPSTTTTTTRATTTTTQFPVFAITPPSGSGSSSGTTSTTAAPTTTTSTTTTTTTTSTTNPPPPVTTTTTAPPHS